MIYHFVPRLNITCCCTSCAIDAKKMSTRVLVSILRARFHPFKDDRHNRIGQAGEVIIAIPVAVGKDPSGNYLINSAEEAMGRDGDGDVGTEHASLLAFAQDALNDVKILHQQVMRKLAEELGAVP